MTGDPTWVRVLEIVPDLLWPLLAALLFLLLYRPLRARLPDLRSLKAGGFEVTFEAARIRDAQGDQVEMPAAELGTAVRRAIAARDRCAGVRALWVDDRPGNNQPLGRAFADLLHLRIDYVLSTEEAIERLRRDHGYDLVLTDMGRGPDRRAGLRLLERMRKEGLHRPVLLFTTAAVASEGAPGGIFGATHRADELLHLIVDVCERRPEAWAPLPI